mmetsp:Transcript_137101/g.292831  ORF Transcript_137101/g.292831 Transcript_137101/m.292831 type:complete len:250 (+) Transcript_137101:55-804(+)
MGGCSCKSLDVALLEAGQEVGVEASEQPEEEDPIDDGSERYGLRHGHTVDLLVARLSSLDVSEGSAVKDEEEKMLGSLSEPSEAATLEEPETEPQDDLDDSERPDFTGSWLCTAVDGDWDAYLREIGTSWPSRKAASSFAFGVRLQMQHIVQSGDRIEIENIVQSCPPRDSRCVYRTDGEQEDIVDLEGKPTKSTTRWEGSTLVTEQCSDGDDRQPLPTIRRFMLGQEMCTSRSTARGLVVKRFYTRVT